MKRVVLPRGIDDLRRLATVEVAALHGTRLNPADVTEAVEQHWRAVVAEEQEQAAQRLAKRRRALVWNAVGKVIPELYRDAWPIDATTARDQMIRRIQDRVYDPVAYQQAIQAGTRIAHGQETMVFLTGASGAGKSTLAAILLRQIAHTWCQSWKQGVVDPRDKFTLDGDPTFARLMCFSRKDEAFTNSIVWISARELVESQKHNQDTSLFSTAPILVIDDAGQEPTQVNIGGVGHVLWARHERAASAVTVLTTGLCDPAKESMYEYLAPLTARYSHALTRRVSEIGRATVIRCKMETRS